MILWGGFGIGWTGRTVILGEACADRSSAGNLHGVRERPRLHRHGCKLPPFGATGGRLKQFAW
jgi:hypothetical protein